MVIVDCVRGEFVMAKSIQPAWVGKLRKQLKRAGEKDSDFSRFGADGHKYQLRPPASEKAIAAFEAHFGVSLPEGYRNFLLWMGNGGAGPFDKEGFNKS